MFIVSGQRQAIAHCSEELTQYNSNDLTGICCFQLVQGIATVVYILLK